MANNFLSKYKLVFLYGGALALLLFLLRMLELHFVIIDHAFEVYIGAIAIIFTGLGIWLALKLAKPKVTTVVVEKEIYINNFTLNEAALNELNLSKREFEVLQLMAEGLSNQEIAARLFLSLPTIKTHAARLFGKMDVKRRTQAIEKAKRLQIIP
jgi:DNA-binding CsgD family transcriptional regulator